MKHGPNIAGFAALIGDPARANILTALMAGKALSAGELAIEAGIMPQTASGHLAKLTEARMLLVEVQGRHRYFRLASPDVAHAIEALMGLAARAGHLRTRQGPRDADMRYARLCYDHLAGEIGTALYDELIRQRLIECTQAGLVVTPLGRSRFIAEGIDMAALEARKRPICRQCLDWSERRPHLAGSLGAALATMFVTRGWGKRDINSRAFLLSPPGLLALQVFIVHRAANERARA